jgi:malate dehydrogenase
MFARTLINTGAKMPLARAFSSSGAASRKVAVLGGAGGIGQPLSLLMKTSDKVSELAVYDVMNAPGVSADLSHVPTPAKVAKNYTADELDEALTGCDLVIIPAGVPRKPGMTRDDLFSVNAGIVQTLTTACARNCPDAVLAIISNPVNSTVPIARKVLQNEGVYNPKKLLGVTTLDVCRANTFVAENQGTDVNDTDVTVIGGHAGITILPLLSQVEGASFSDEDREALTVRIQFGGDEVVQAKDGAGSATLSMAYAAYVFGERMLAAMDGEKDVVECCYVESDIVPGCEFFSSPCRLGPDGVEEVMGFGELSEYEQGWFDKMLPDLQGQIAKGNDF